ncbi:MAG: hypothetical protein MPK62_02335 [Alphaproteobacteria bacterium]|nr:hypothetical protein [Alphaproteobacteria bacterium]MDA8029973.1 hypothetical protein [Alphaproteobacteria bacterium]
MTRPGFEPAFTNAFGVTYNVKWPRQFDETMKKMYIPVYKKIADVMHADKNEILGFHADSNEPNADFAIESRKKLSRWAREELDRRGIEIVVAYVAKRKSDPTINFFKIKRHEDLINRLQHRR